MTVFKPWMAFVLLAAGMGLFVWYVQTTSYNVGKVEQKAETATTETKIVKEVAKQVAKKRTEVINEVQQVRSDVDKRDASAIADELRDEWSRSSH